MYITLVALVSIVLSTTNAQAEAWFEMNNELVRVVRDGQTFCRLWVISPVQEIGFSLRDAHLSAVIYELTAIRAGSIYITTDPDLVVLRGTCGFPHGIMIRTMPPPWPTPPPP